MEKKRSIGVTIIAWYFILQAWIGLGYINDSFYLAMLFVCIFICIGIGLLKLFNAARLGAILIFAISSLYFIFLNLKLLKQYSFSQFFQYPNSLVTGKTFSGLIVSVVLWGLSPKVVPVRLVFL